jgi:diguanylate cyclase (GGDEF)-like protein
MYALHSAAETLINETPHEMLRLEALEEFDILDTSKEEIFDRLTRLARRVFGVQICMVTFVDAHRQWFKSCVGMDLTETPREPSFCNYAVQNACELVIEDTFRDTRFKDNLFVTGAPYIRFYAGIPLTPNGGPAIGTLCIINTEPRLFGKDDLDMLRDLARMAEMALELRKLATVDGLTGAHTRRAFRQEFDRLMTLAARHGHGVSVVTFDIDHFKRINDTYGHAGGDIVLEGVVGVCRKFLRATDFVGRLGGEEFAIALPNTDRAGAMKVAEQLRKAIEATAFIFNDERIDVTASFGVSTQSSPSDDADKIIARADAALYEAKKAGRNRSVAANEGISEIDGHRVLKAGLIGFNAGRSQVECTVRRLSATGAHIQVSTDAVVPDTFKLKIAADGISRMCRIVERKGTTIIVSM